MQHLGVRGDMGDLGYPRELNELEPDFDLWRWRLKPRLLLENHFEVNITQFAFKLGCYFTIFLEVEAMIQGEREGGKRPRERLNEIREVSTFRL